MTKFELVFIPLLASSHLTSAIEFAKRLVDQDETLSITFLMILLPNQTDLDPKTKSVAASYTRIRFIIIPPTIACMLVGFVLDMFCTSMIDIANKCMVPSYIIFTSNAAFLGFLCHLPVRHEKLGGVEFYPSDPDSVIPSFEHPVPTNVLPGAVLDKTGGGYEAFLYHGTRIQECKGVIVNSFVELEPYAFDSVRGSPTVYAVGPLLEDKKGCNSTGWIGIKNWLDNQPLKSGAGEPQLEQMAIALERSGHRFLWSIRKPPPKDTLEAPTEYTNLEDALPDEFIERVKERGMVCGWAPQVEVLAHGAIKGFVSHCGWNSILESLVYGVPIATWPLAAEQQLNAFGLVRELGLAVELSLSYRSNGSELVMADQIEKAICSLMDDENPVRETVKKISDKSRKVLENGGSSVVTLGKFVDDLLQNIC
ncbi:UDP-glycosyltransferase 71K1-like protein [Tanacetum coccineum]